eukprot:6489615-Amphidinium_carterae.1
MSDSKGLARSWTFERVVGGSNAYEFCTRATAGVLTSTQQSLLLMGQRRRTMRTPAIGGPLPLYLLQASLAAFVSLDKVLHGRPGPEPDPPCTCYDGEDA